MQGWEAGLDGGCALSTNTRCVIAVAEGAGSAGLVCHPHPRCGTRRFTTRVAQIRAAAAPCRRFKPPNAGDYATSPWHRAVAWLKPTRQQIRPGRVHVGRKPPLCSADRAAGCRDHTTREDSIPERGTYNMHVKPCGHYAPHERHRTIKQTTGSGQRSLRNEMVARFLIEWVARRPTAKLKYEFVPV